MMEYVLYNDGVCMSVCLTGKNEPTFGPHWKLFFPSKDEAVYIYFINLNSNCYAFMRVLRGFASDGKGWIFSFLHWSVPLHMSPQWPRVRAGKVTLIAFVWLFSTVCFQMCPQTSCTRGGIITLVTFIWLFSTVCFQMCHQMSCLWGCKVTLVAFVQLFSTVCFQMCP